MASLFTETITSMTAIFTPPASCSGSYTFEAEFYNSVEGGLLVQNIDQGEFNTDCFPPDFEAYGRAPSSIQVYSPGWCPEGYATPGQFQNGGTTTAICCPSSFSFGSTYSSINFYGSSSVLFAGCISTFSGTTTVSARGNSSMIPVSGTEITMWAQPISVEYEQRDLSLFDITSSTTGAGATTSGGSISNTATLPSNTVEAPGAAQTSGGGGGNGTDSSSTTTTTTSEGLSTGAVAGIAVGASLAGVAGLAALGFFIWRKRRNARKANKGGANGGAYYAQDSKEPLRNQQQQQQQQIWERREMDAGPGSEYRPELDGRESSPGGGFQGREVRARQRPGEFSELA